MTKFVVAIYPEESRAYAGVRALKELHREGSVTLYGLEVVERNVDGKLAIKQRSDDGPLGLGLGALVGGMIGMFGGPAGAAAGMAGGAWGGSWRDYLNAEVSDAFLEGVGKELVPGKIAVVAEVDEEWIAPLDTRVEAIGGSVFRESREDFVDDLIERRANARKSELSTRKEEHAGAKAQKMESKLEKQIGDVQENLQRTAEQARERLDQTKQEMETKLKALEEQAAKANPEVKSRIDHRIAEIREEFGRREAKLKHAYEVTQEALRA